MTTKRLLDFERFVRFLAERPLKRKSNMANMIEPCCAERQLPQLLREKKGHAVMLQTSGDVTVTAMTKAVSGMTGRGHRMTLWVPEVTKETLAFVAKGIRLGTMRGVRLLTRDDQRELVREVLADVIGMVSQEHGAVEVVYGVDETLTDDVLMFDGPQGVVVLHGTMVQNVEPGLHMYGGIFATDAAIVTAVIGDAIESRTRLRGASVVAEQPDEAPADATGDVAGSVVDTPDEKPAKKKKTKE